jgi:hypothetical protein
VDPELKARIERESEALFSSARLWVCRQGREVTTHANQCRMMG